MTPNGKAPARTGAYVGGESGGRHPLTQSSPQICEKQEPTEDQVRTLAALLEVPECSILAMPSDELWRRLLDRARETEGSIELMQRRRDHLDLALYQLRGRR